MEPISQHRYYPTTLVLPEYVPNERGVLSITGEFGVIWILLLSSVWALMGRYAKELERTDKIIVLWFVLCGTLHTFFEGYFVLNNSTIGSKQTLFAQLWKEYALADSRYLTGDLVVLCAEALTLLLWGPLSYLTAAAIIKSSPWRHPLQIIVSMGQALGDLLYMSTSLVDLYARQNLYSRPEPYYLWFYFFAMNAIWLVVPGVLIYQSSSTISQVFGALEEIKELCSQQGKGEAMEDGCVKTG